MEDHNANLTPLVTRFIFLSLLIIIRWSKLHIGRFW